ncbi:ecdysone 20-monooxygenase-like [Uloborus diversus]|uniref:ecdysone 20-monooxygenase-like n=1 Tax=Uloborus diversus TaxID=327109 RepID=UPI00240A5C9D|nr:ecdysone 20-monooxygenase-like [Uloborus diversus]
MAARKVCSGVATSLGGGALSLARPSTQKTTTPTQGINDIPGPWPSLPLVGTGWQYFPGGRYNLSNLHESSFDKFRRYGPVVREEFQWRRPVVHLFRPEDFQTVFQHQGRYPVRPVSEFVQHYRLSNPDKYDTPGLANSVGEEWRRLRKMLTPVLKRMSALDDMVCDMDALCEDFAEVIRAGREEGSCVVDNLQEYVYRLALEAVYLLSLEVRLGCLEPRLSPSGDASAMISSVKLLFEAFQELYYGLPLWKFVQTESYRKLDRAESTMYDVVSRRIREMIEEQPRTVQEPSPGQRPNVLQSLLANKNLTEKEIRVTVIDFISGGIFTVTNTFSFLLYHLSRNPDVQEKLYREVSDVMPDGVVTKDALKQMHYLKACVTESYRLTPTIPTITRILPEDIEVSGYNIPAGVPLFCNFMVPCMQPDRFREPHRFEPDRWTDPDRKHNPWSILPFGYGNRMCVGKRFAELEMHSALAKLVYRFKLESTGQEVKCKQAFIVVPSHPISIIFKDR